MSSPGSNDFGAMLRAARERRGLTLLQVSETTKISPSVLTALEADDVGNLPGGLFIRAFVRSYAAEVGLDPERTVDALLEAYPDQRHDTVVRPRDESATLSHSRKQPGLGPMAIGLLIVSVIVVGLLMFFAFRGGDGSDGNGASSDFDERSRVVGLAAIERSTSE